VIIRDGRRADLARMALRTGSRANEPLECTEGSAGAHVPRLFK